MNILIAGGAGFIGSHLVDYHLSLNDSVIVVDNLSTGLIENISSHFENANFSFHDVDVLSWPDLDSTLAQCDLIYDLVAVVGMFNVIEHPISTLDVNIHASEKLLMSLSKLDKKPLIVVFSTSEVYGSRTGAMKESDSLLIEATSKTHASYPVSKLCNEISAIAYYKEKNVPVIVTRLFNTVGPRQSSRYGMVLPRFIQQALNNELLTIFDDGMQTRCFCDVRDLCKMLHQLTRNKNSVGQIVNVGRGDEMSILDLATLVKSLTHSHSEFKFIKFDDVYGRDYINIEHRKPDLTKIKSLIDYQLEWSLERTIENMVSNLYSKK